MTAPDTAAPHGTLLTSLTFGTPTLPPVPAPTTNPYGLTNGGINASLNFADINDDGKLDAFIGNRVGDTQVYLNTGTTTAPIFGTPAINPMA